MNEQPDFTSEDVEAVVRQTIAEGIVEAAEMDIDFPFSISSIEGKCVRVNPIAYGDLAGTWCLSITQGKDIVQQAVLDREQAFLLGIALLEASKEDE